MSNRITVHNGASPLFLVFLVFLVLKLTEIIGWSWWWVSAPIWGPVALFGVIVALFGAIMAPILLFKFFAWIFGRPF